MKPVTVRRWEVGALILILLAFMSLWAWWFQAGRLSSCHRTYEGVRQVFQPFLTPPPKPGDGKRYNDYLKFNNRIDELKGQCGKQVRLWWPTG